MSVETAVGRRAAGDVSAMTPRYATFDPPPRPRSPLFWLYEAWLVPGEHAMAMRCRKR